VTGTIIVFAGPSLPAADREARPDVEFRPPVAQGDVVEAALEQPWAIGIVDGYFEWTPAVWHKEILWAMRQGIRTYGSSSIGALRACELHPYGMQGVGRVFEQFHTGELEDDDEVTLVHGGVDDGFVPTSEPMVNIRATLSAAEREGVISASSYGSIVAAVKSTFYPSRSYALVIEAANAIDPDEARRLAGWLPTGRIDQKRLDASLLLDRMIADREREGDSPWRPSFGFEHTDAWEQVLRQAHGRLSSRTGPDDVGDPVLDELRLQPDLFDEVRHAALVDSLAGWVAGDADDVSGPALQDAVAAFWSRQPAGDRDIDAWLAANRLQERQLVRLIERDARLRHVKAVASADLERAIADVTALHGHRAELFERAERKQRDLAATGLDTPTLTRAGVTEAELWAWFFGALGRAVPTDLTQAAIDLGFRHVAALRRAALREYCWVVVVGRASPTGADDGTGDAVDEPVR
jgi:hypothetical protein